jgi:hypothetical protein
MSRLTNTRIAGRILDYLVLAFCLWRTTGECHLHPGLLKLLLNQQLPTRVSELMHANMLCDVSFRTFGKLMGVQDVPPSRYELLVTILYLDDLFESETSRVEAAVLSIRLMDGLEERSFQFFQTLQISPDFYGQIVKGYSHFFQSINCPYFPLFVY